MTDHLDRLRNALAETYRIEREIGQGGMAVVYLARDLKHDRPVAIKVLQPGVAASLGHDRFLREIEIAARLQHPHVLPVYDSGQADGVLYYVMPFVEGESLYERLRNGPLPPAEAVRIAREVADALDYAHRHGVVHRDIKPANVLLSEGHAIVADFGIARALSAAQGGGKGLTQAGMAVGTPAYMSPEQALGSDIIDGRSDVYALGVVLYEMLTGTPPYVGTTPQSVVSQALAGNVPALPEGRRQFQPILNRALAKEPKDRFATGAELSAALEPLITGSGTAAAATPTSGRGMVGLAALAIAAIVAFVAWPREFRADGNPRHSLIIFPFENKTGDPTRDYLGEAAMNLLGLAASHWADLRIHDDERTASLLRRRGVEAGGDLDFDLAQRMAREAKVGTLVLGDIRREGDSLTIEAKVHDVRSGDRIATHIVRAGWNDDPRPLFDRIASLILGTSGAPPGEYPSVLAQTTTSIEAYRAYLAGTSAMQRFQVDSAKRLLNEAVRLDSSFALAYLRLRDAEGWISGLGGGNAELRRQDVLLAEKYSASLPPRLRALVAFHRAYEDGNFRRAREIVEGLIAKDSTDVEAWYQLGEAHFHHNSGLFPHADTLGNMGRALHAFERTLALDSSYILAYQHILDALAGCAGNNALVCLPDSAAYGTPQELTAEFGQAFIARRQADARADQITAARGWVAAAPGTPRARLTLARVLKDQGRIEDAKGELATLASLGGGSQAGMLLAIILFEQGAPGPAAAALDSALRQSPDTTTILNTLPSLAIPMGMLAGAGGRLGAAMRLMNTIMDAIPTDSLLGPGTLMLSIPELVTLNEQYLYGEIGDRRTGALATGTINLIDRRAGRDTAARRAYHTSFGSTQLLSYLTVRDTSLITPLATMVDTTGSSTWRVVDGQLALARGDSAHARARVDLSFRNPERNELIGEQGMVRAFAWGDLLARLGLLREAMSAYAAMDTNSTRDQHAGLYVRSLAERAAIAQAMGNTELAIQYYQRFVDAWADADELLQPAVEKARTAMAALRGEVREPVKR